METAATPAQQQEKPLAESLIKYLPIFVIGHAVVTIPTRVMANWSTFGERSFAGTNGESQAGF